MRQEFQMLVESAIAVLGFFLVYLFNRLTQDLGKLTNSVEQLNVKIAVVISRLETHSERLDRLERIERNQ